MVVTTFTTPSGTPARRQSWYLCQAHTTTVQMLTSAIAKAEKGVSGGGLMTAVQPAAKAGPSFRVIIADGKFQGVMIDLSNYQSTDMCRSTERTRRLTNLSKHTTKDNQ